ncbi:MAG: hypothetical protein RLZZ350_759 [Verrucomicrobiota bacterium]|jgi:hypothetical protein
MPRDPKLLTLQRDFMRALREPIVGGSRVPTPLARRSGKTSAGFGRVAKNWITPSAKLKPVERLELYHRQYWYRLLDSIAEDFPALRRLLGERRFWRLIEAYLAATPSRSYTLRHLGGKLSAFLKKNPALAGSHPFHAVELAALEYAVCENFEAAERAPVAADELATAKLALQPHLRLFQFRTPADELWHCHVLEKTIPKKLLTPVVAAVSRRKPLHDARKSQRGLSSTTTPKTAVAVFRLHFGTRVERLDPRAFALLNAVTQTGSLEKAFRHAQLDRDAATLAQVQSWFQLWTERGWLCARDDRENFVAAKSKRSTKANRPDAATSVAEDALLARSEKSNIMRLKF